MKYDVDRYTELVRRAEFDPGFRLGTADDLSRWRYPGTLVSDPRWRQVNHWRGLDSVDGRSHLAPTPELDCTQDFWIECLFIPDQAGVTPIDLVAQFNYESGHGSWAFRWDGTQRIATLDMYDGLGAVARSIQTQKLVVNQALYPYHIVVASWASGAGGQIWIWGVPVTTVLDGAGMVEPLMSIHETTFLHTLGAGVQCEVTEIVGRAWLGKPTNEDVAALAGAAIEMVRC